jgi:hypothetical protein
MRVRRRAGPAGEEVARVGPQDQAARAAGDQPAAACGGAGTEGRGPPCAVRSHCRRPRPLAAIADGDPRPLLVLRECDACRGSSDAFLSRTLDNEKTELLGRWFHAVRLGPEVLEPDHPLHALFPGQAPAHLFTATLDGRTRVELDGAQSQAQLWQAMTTVLRKTYRRDPDAAVRGLQKLLDQLDESDARLVGDRGSADDRARRARLRGALRRRTSSASATSCPRRARSCSSRAATWTTCS